MSMSREEIDRLVKFAMAFARKKLRSVSPRLSRDPHELARDLTQAAFEQLVKKWTPEKCKAEAFLSVCIKHELDAILRKHETFGITYGYPENVFLLRDTLQLQDEKILEQQQRDAVLAYIEANHPEARILAELILDYDGEITRAELAELMKVAASHVDYLKRRLKPIISNFLKEATNSDSPANQLLRKINGEQR